MSIADKSAIEADKSASPASVLVADFPNPFTEVSESEADRKDGRPTKSNSVGDDTADMNVEVKSPPIAAQPETVVDEDPFTGGPKDFSEPTIDEKMGPGANSRTPTSPGLALPPASALTSEVESDPAPVEPMPEETKPTAETTPPASEVPAEVDATTPPDATPDPQTEKMRRIRERFGMKGLKGFCPVTLHDERELVDARPEFHFTHRSQKFHFATAEARDKFEAEPGKYAPAAYGADVVALSRDKDVVEGTLDFAAWFKGRLYLFGSQANYDTFIATPAKYATLVGIE